jgi:hypothetical protein
MGERRLHGKAAVRAYWLRQWNELDPNLEPVSATTRPDGRVAVGVLQVVRAHGGELLPLIAVPIVRFGVARSAKALVPGRRGRLTHRSTWPNGGPGAASCRSQ